MLCSLVPGSEALHLLTVYLVTSYYQDRVEGHYDIDMDREECEAGLDKDQDILNIPFIDDDNDDDNDKKVIRKEGINRPHEKLRTIQHITDHRGS